MRTYVLLGLIAFALQTGCMHRGNTDSANSRDKSDIQHRYLIVAASATRAHNDETYRHYATLITDAWNTAKPSGPARVRSDAKMHMDLSENIDSLAGTDTLQVTALIDLASPVDKHSLQPFLSQMEASLGERSRVILPVYAANSASERKEALAGALRAFYSSYFEPLPTEETGNEAWDTTLERLDESDLALLTSLARNLRALSDPSQRSSDAFGIRVLQLSEAAAWLTRNRDHCDDALRTLSDTATTGDATDHSSVDWDFFLRSAVDDQLYHAPGLPVSYQLPESGWLGNFDLAGVEPPSPHPTFDDKLEHTGLTVAHLVARCLSQGVTHPDSEPFLIRASAGAIHTPTHATPTMRAGLAANPTGTPSAWTRHTEAQLAAQMPQGPGLFLLSY